MRGKKRPRALLPKGLLPLDCAATRDPWELSREARVPPRADPRGLGLWLRFGSRRTHDGCLASGYGGIECVVMVPMWAIGFLSLSVVPLVLFVD